MDEINYNLTKQHFSTKIYKSYLQYLSIHYPSINLSELCLRAGLPPEYVFKSEGWVSVEFNYRFMGEIKKLVTDDDFEYKVGESSFSKDIMGPVYYLMKNVMSLGSVYDNLWKLTKYFNKVVEYRAMEKRNGQLTIEVRLIEEGLTAEEYRLLKLSLADIVNNSLGFYSGFSRVRKIGSTTVSSIKYSDSVYHIVVKYPLEGHLILGGLSYPFIVTLGILFSSHALSDDWYKSSFFAGFVFSIFFAIILKRNAVELTEAANESESTLNKLDGQYQNLVETKIFLQRKLLEAQAINELTNILIQSSNAKDLLQNAADNLTRILDFDRVIVMVPDSEKKFLNVGATSVQEPQIGDIVQAFKLEIDIKSSDKMKVSNIFKSGESIFIENVNDHIQTLNVESQQVLKISRSKSFIGVAIRSSEESYGVLLADTFYSNRKLSADDVKILETAGRQISIALEKQKAKEDLEIAYSDLEELANSYSRFVPFEAIHLLGFKSVKEVKMSQGVELNMTVVFCDIRGFTSRSEIMSPADTMAFLNSYFSSLAPVFSRNNGIIDKFMGDGIMALFLKPEDALKAAAEFQIELIEYNKRNPTYSIRTGMGVHTGKVLLGAVGYEDRLSISVVSDAVNLASRLDGLTKKFGVDILCTEEVFAASADQRFFRNIAVLNVEGRRGKTKIYEYFGFANEFDIQMKRKNSSILAKILAAEVKGEIIDYCLSDQSNDSVLKYYISLNKSAS